MQQDNISPEQKAAVAKRIHRSSKFQKVFKGSDGDFVLNEIDTQVNYKGNTFDPDPYISAYNQGQRSIAVFLHNVLEQDVEQARKLLGKESKK